MALENYLPQLTSRNNFLCRCCCRCRCAWEILSARIRRFCYQFMWVKERTILAPVLNFLKMAFWRCHFISFSLPMTRNLIGMRWRRNCQNRLNWKLGLQHFELHISSVGIFKLCCFVCACRDIPGVPSLRLLIFKKHFFKLSCDIFGEINTFILFLELLFNTFHSLPSKQF